MGFKFNPFTGTFDQVGSGGSGSVSIGDAIGGADPDRVLFTDASGNLAQSLDLFYSDSTRSFSIGGGTPDIGMIFGGTIQHTDGSTLVFNSGVNVGEFAVNASFADNVYFRVGANISGYLISTDPLNEWVNFGTNSDIGGFVNMVAINGLDDTLRIRTLAGQTGRLTSWQSVATNQLVGVNVSGELEFGTTSQGAKIWGSTAGYLSFKGYGNANNEELQLDLETVANTANWVTTTGITNWRLPFSLDVGGSAGVRISGASGVLTLAGIGGANNENLTFNFESVANTVTIASGTGVSTITASSFGASFSSVTAAIICTDNVGVSFGSGTDARFEFDTSEGNDTLKLGLVCGSVNSSGYFLICESADINTNFGVGTPTDPHLRLQSSDATQTSDYIEFWHDQTDANIGVGNGNLKINKAIDLTQISAGTENFLITATSDTPTVTWGAAAGNEASAAPAGYIEILVGANRRYIPFWA